MKQAADDLGVGTPFLFSIGVISCNNSHYIYETLESILKQDYSRIEVLVSDDASPDFDKAAVERYIQTHSRPNLVRYQVWHQKTNLGTVANAEFCRKNAAGEAFFLIAADDRLDNDGVISAFAGEMQSAPQNIGIFSGTALMCGLELNQINGQWSSPAEAALIREGNCRKIFSRLSNRTLIPTTGTCYRMSLLERLGGYDTTYHLIEDAPLYLKAARTGAGFRWINNLIVGRHRAGGVCHKGIDYMDPAFCRYTEDRMRIFRKEVFPYLAQIDPKEFDAMLELWYNSRSRYVKSHGKTSAARGWIYLRYSTLGTILWCLAASPASSGKIRAFYTVAKRHLKNCYHRFF